MAYLIYTTVPDIDTARRIAGEMIEKRLAACANILPAHESIYWWEGAVQNETEHVLVFKTSAEKLEALEKAFITAHPYDVPCFVALPIEKGHNPFLMWIKSQLA